MTDLQVWIDDNKPDDGMIWNRSAVLQSDRFLKLVESMGDTARAKVVTKHRSKSIDLPVIEIRTPSGVFLLRDNFYDVNLCVLWDSAVDLPLSDVYGEPLEWAWYLGEIKKARDYSWRGWTDEQMDDPTVLRVRHDNRDGWLDTTGAKKDRWLDRLTNTEWWTADWSSGSLLLDGKLGPCCGFYRAARCFAEGISSVVQSSALRPYGVDGNCRTFTVCLPDLEAAQNLMLMIGATATP